MKTKYRIVYKGYRFYLQFLYHGSFMEIKYKCWKYIPNSVVANVFTQKQAPSYLPFITSHCFIADTDKETIQNIANGTDDVQQLFDRAVEMRDKQKNYQKTEYIN